VFKYTAECQSFSTASRAFQTADASQIVRAFFRFYPVFAQFVASLAAIALIKVKPQKKGRDPIEECKYRSKRAQYPAPGPSYEENGHQEQRKDCQLKRVGPGNLLPGNRPAYYIRHRRLQSPGGAQPTNKKPVPFAKQVWHGNNRSNEYHVAKISRQSRWIELWSWNLSSQILQKTEGTSPPADNTAQQNPDKNQHPDCNERKNMYRAKIGKNSDGTCESSQRTGVTVEHRAANAMKTPSQRIQPN
jgi:hypothetical protein